MTYIDYRASYVHMGVPHCPACPGPPDHVNLIYVHKYHTILKGKGLEAAACGPLTAST